VLEEHTLEGAARPEDVHPDFLPPIRRIAQPPGTTGRDSGQDRELTRKGRAEGTRVRNQVQLITYADRLAGDLPGLRAALDGPLAGLFGGVHVLPFFTPYDGADAGFDPVDHTAVDPRLGSWADVRALSERYDTVADLIVNHVSADSEQFRDVQARGPESEYAGMFLTFAGVFPGGATEAELLAIFRPRPGLPFTPMTLGPDRRLVWTTFTTQQIDIDVRDPQGQAYLDRVLRALADAGVAMIRVDAVGYAIKTPGTSCFMTAETFEFIDELTERARRLGVEVLVEVHSYYQRQIEIGHRVDWVYDFALPPLVLHGLFTGDAQPLRDWLTVRPRNAITVLDTHDGIGVVDVGADSGPGREPGLLTTAQIDALVEGIHTRSGGASRQATGWAASNVDVYQVNCTYYDALGGDDRRYLLARLLQLFAPGIPQVYYVGLLAGENDLELLHRTGVGRDINRHHYTAAELDAALARPVVRALLALIRFRNSHPAFGGEFIVGADDGPGRLSLLWTAGEELAELTADLASADFAVTFTQHGQRQTVTDLEELPSTRA
jgi:sucrose phosphorylase